MKRTHITALSLSLLPLAGAITLSNACSTSSPPKADGPFDGNVPIGDRASIANLQGPVDVVRDRYGMIHIYATSTTDAMRVEGYQVAKDRTAQLELIRRTAEGRLAAVLGDASPGLIDSDIAMRTVGLHRVGKQMYEALGADSELRAWVDAYADGISQFNARLQTGDEDIPKSMVGLPKKAFEPWTGADVLAIGRLQAYNLGYSGDEEIAQTDFIEAARAKFVPTATDDALKKRAGFLQDFVRFAPLDPTTVMDGFPNDAALTGSPISFTPPAVDSLRVPRALLDATRAWRDAEASARGLIGKRGFTGSNNWVVGPSRTATGHAMLASDPHLSLSAPSVFWMVHVNVTVPGGDPAKNLDFAGLSFPGIAGIILGFNRDVAWGATTADYDVTDVYKETLSADGASVTFKGQPVAIQKVRETIEIAGSAPLQYDVLMVPHHGPLVPNIVNHKVVPPDPASGALSIRWTGHQPTKDLEAIAGLLRAKSTDDARAAYRSFAVGAQNWVVADTKGDIFYTSQATIPKRDRAAFAWDASKFTGQLPCFVLPGDGTAEWTGVLEESFIPHVKNPAKAYVGTANGDQVGVTLDNDPSNDKLPNGEAIYTGCWHDPGFRVSRIHQRIEGVGHPMTADDMASIQADARSAMGAMLAPKIVLAVLHAEEEAASAGAHPDLTALVGGARYKAAPLAEVKDLLARWAAESDYDAAAGVSLDDGSPSVDAKEAAASKATLLFNVWLTRMIAATLADELTALNQLDAAFDLRRVLAYLLTADPTSLATYDATAKDSVLFDDLATTGIVESRDERVLSSLLDALDFLKAKLGDDHDAWRWGKLHTLRFSALVSLWGSLSIPQIGDAIFPNGFPRHGDGYNVDVGEYDGRPAKLADATFTYSHGPTQRFVIDMAPGGPVARNALPGGNVWDNTSSHFRDEADRWRKNQNRPVPFAKADVVEAAETRTLYATAK